MCIRDRLCALISPYAHARQLGALKWLEQAFTDELLAHAVTSVADLDDGPVSTFSERNPNPPILRRRVKGILNQMTNNALKAIFMASCRQAFRNSNFNISSLFHFTLADAFNDIGK